MLLEVLVIVIAAVWMIVSMLRWSKLVQLLGACSKLILVAISSHWHYKFVSEWKVNVFSLNLLCPGGC
jgi:hypothetical protein